MISKAFQNVVNQMGEVMPFTMGVMDREGVILANKGREPYMDMVDRMVLGVAIAETIYEIEGFSVYGVGVEKKIDYVVYVQGTSTEEKNFCHMLAVALGNVRLYYDEKYDKTTFIKNIILDNLLTFDLYQKARELHIQFDAPREIFMVKVIEAGEVTAYDALRAMFPDKEKDFVISIDDYNVAIIKEVRENSLPAEFDAMAISIYDSLTTEAFIVPLIGVSRICSDLSKIANGYKETQVALEVGKVFETEKSILSYEQLGIGRLIYQLPIRLCELYLEEVFKKGGVDDLDDETLLTIQKFFENDLNVSETSRQLFVHRNTLVYRLDKINKITGLDLRKFDQAIVFKVAMMVNKYLAFNPIKM